MTAARHPEIEALLDLIERARTRLQSVSPFCAWCHRNVNGWMKPTEPHADDCWELKVDAVRAALRSQAAKEPPWRDVVTEYLEWGAMTGSDRHLFDQKFRALLKEAVNVQPATNPDA